MIPPRIILVVKNGIRLTGVLAFGSPAPNLLVGVRPLQSECFYIASIPTGAPARALDDNEIVLIGAQAVVGCHRIGAAKSGTQARPRGEDYHESK
jgi:hypothetical protein